MIMANAYDAFASAYDALNSDADYTAMADPYRQSIRALKYSALVARSRSRMRNGMLTRELDARGYDMTGVDSSEEMLGVRLTKIRRKAERYYTFARTSPNLSFTAQLPPRSVRPTRSTT